MYILNIKELTDGSAILEMEMTLEEKELLIQYALVDLMKKYICAEAQNSESDEFVASGTTRSHDEEDE